ncbi:MAG: copper chaperone PCu(A)C [Mariprofundaceae bacterium]|nr:copper chaperone PCu(A)C [Mariprofundaceae bacterium]
MKRIIGILLIYTAVIWCINPAYAGVRAEHAWVRMPPPVADTAAVYMTLHNESDRDVVAVRISSDVSRNAGIHMIRKQGAVMRMSVVNNITIPAHGFVKLEPGTMHVMLTGLEQVLKQGQGVHIMLEFTDGSIIKVVARVRDMRSALQPASQLYDQAMNLVRKKNMTDAASLFRQAGEQGNRQAQYQMGLLYARGDGVKKDFIKAREWLYKAAVQGHPKAQFYLGQMYAFGDGGEKDNTRAATWFWLATTLGDRYARDSLRVVSGKISSRELTEAKKQAKALWQKMPHDMKIEHEMGMH